MYQVLGPDGQLSAAMDVNALRTLAQQGQLRPDQILVDPLSGQQLPAGQVLAQLPAALAGAAPLPYQSGAQVDPSILGLRLGAYLIDFLCAVPLMIPAMIPFVGILFAPLLALYWLSRDALFGGRSIGKKLLGLRVVRTDGLPFSWATSVLRNIVYAPLLLAAIPVAGAVLNGSLMFVISLVELILVLTTQLRIGDRLANTVVVRDPALPPGAA